MRRGTGGSCPPRCVGMLLIRAAVAMSDDLGFHGRIGLHSPPQASGFYANTCGMTDAGHGSLHRFEMMIGGHTRAFAV